jgi:Tol biopolymer transport system component
VSADPAPAPAPAKLLLAFTSYRERAKHSNVFFYEHDGVSQGKVVGSITTPRGVASTDSHPSLSHDGRFCAFTYELENNAGRIHYWDRKEQKLVELPEINSSPNAQMQPSLSGDGKFLAFAAWNRPGAAGQSWHIFLYDVTAKKMGTLPELNTSMSDERMPALDGMGRFLAFTSNRKGGAGLNDVYLYNRQTGKLVDLPGLNSKHMDQQPALSADGNLVAFASDRPGGSGGRDIYLYDRTTSKLLPLPGLNTAAHEYSPSLSPDGRFIAFVSERLGGEGERDIYLYDRKTQKVLPTPGLNSKADDFDPCLILLKGE